MSQAIAYRVYELPWTANEEQEQRFRRVIRTALVAGAVLAWRPPELPPDWGTLLPVADLAAGERAFARCAACHTVARGG